MYIDFFYIKIVLQETTTASLTHHCQWLADCRPFDGRRSAKTDQLVSVHRYHLIANIYYFCLCPSAKKAFRPTSEKKTRQLCSASFLVLLNFEEWERGIAGNVSLPTNLPARRLFPRGTTTLVS